MLVVCWRVHVVDESVLPTQVDLLLMPMGPQLTLRPASGDHPFKTF